MSSTTPSDRSQVKRLDRPALNAYQLDRLNNLLAEILPRNTFYQHKLAGYPTKLDNLDQLASLPFTTKEELQPQPDSEPFAFNRTYPIEQYVRCHQTSGTRGRPLVVLDTAEDWRWWNDAWQYVLDAADVRSTDRALLAFSFGPFIGFWSAFDALIARGTLVIPGGGLSSAARLETLRGTKATILLCTPTYALHLVEVAAEHKFNLKQLSVKKIIVAGEPGGSVAATRERVETAWDAQLIDHAGATEVGPWGFADADGKGLYVNEAHFIPEFLSVATGHPAQSGEPSHLILTCLGRSGSPVIRYRTGDIVCPTWPTGASCNFVLLEGGIIGRADDMMIVRGMNVYPTAVEHIAFSFPEVVEYRLTARKHGAMDELFIEVEDRLQLPARIADELQLRLGLKINVRCVPPLSLPRFEGKGRRFVDERNRP
jgi:phenylacetate-CoA ligase